MKSNIFITEKEIEVAKRLFLDVYLPGPIKCFCGGNDFTIHQTIHHYALSSVFTINVGENIPLEKFFYPLFSFIPLRIVSELISCFLCKDFNVDKALKFMADDLNYNISNKVIYRLYKEMRSIIYKYMRFVYETECIAEENGNGFFLIDESLIGHKNGQQLWLIGAINNISKQLRIEAVFEKNTNTIKNFIKKYIPIGNKVITDGFVSYNFFD